MGKTNRINGLPNTLIQQYFSTLFYYSKGYMADWIWNAAEEKQISEIKIDILKKTVEPVELEIKPITVYLDLLQETIRKELSANGFESDFIKSAKLQIVLPDKRKKLLNCESTLIDKNERIYKSKKYSEVAYDNKFKVFQFSVVEKIKNIFVN